MEKIKGLIADLISGDDGRAETAVRELAPIGEEALPTLRELISSKEADTRWWATWALAAITHPEVPPILRQLLKDPDIAVRQCAALALRQQPTAEAVPDLIALLKEEDAVLIRLAGAALAAIGKDAVPALIETMENGPPQARLEAVRALATIGDDRSIAVLFKAFEEDSALMEYWANEGLERIGVGMSFFKP